MAEIINLTLADLLLDAKNPRLPVPNEGQREAFRSLAEHLKRKLLALAEDILEWGMDPSNLPFVIPMNDDRKRYLVLEGNRRLAALKALENPEPLSGAVDKKIFEELRNLSKQYQGSPIESIPCILLKKREDAHHWIKLRHTGENGGAGVVPWSSDEATRFGARGGDLEIHTQALDFLERRGDLTVDERRRIPASSIKRLLGTPEVREKAGLDWKDNKLLLLAKPDKVAKALLYIVKDFSDGGKKTEDIYTKEKRIEYAKSIPATVAVPTSSHTAQPTAASAAKGASKPKQPRAKRAKPRDVLIPRDCILQVTEQRIADIEDELRRLSLTDFTNSVSVLSRVFLELTVDTYIDTAPLSTKPGEKLRVKLQAVLEDLVSKTKLTAAQARPLRRALQKNSFLMPSLDLLNEYVHDSNVYPEPTDLRAAWNNLQPFFAAIWSP